MLPRKGCQDSPVRPETGRQAAPRKLRHGDPPNLKQARSVRARVSGRVHRPLGPGSHIIMAPLRGHLQLR